MVKHIIVLHSTPAPAPAPKPEPPRRHPFLDPLTNAISDIEKAIAEIKATDPERDTYVVVRGGMNSELWDALWYYIRFTYGFALRDAESAKIYLH